MGKGTQCIEWGIKGHTTESQFWGEKIKWGLFLSVRMVATFLYLKKMFSIFYLIIFVCFSPLDCKYHENRDFCLVFLLLFPQSLEQYSINIY